MAAVSLSAPLQRSALVEELHFQEVVLQSRALTEKILLAIPDAHKSCVHIESLQLDSSENSKLVIMARTINMPAPPVLRTTSENSSLESGLIQMFEGLQLQQALLSSLSLRLGNGETVADLLADVRDLAIQIKKMLKMLESAAQPTPAPVALHLQDEYGAQVAVHLTLVHLQGFGRDMVRFLRGLEPSSEEESDS